MKQCLIVTNILADFQGGNLKAGEGNSQELMARDRPKKGDAIA
jgi:hypothetical protein